MKAKESKGGYSYGICMFYEKGRYPTLVNWCKKHGYSATSLEGQTRFVAYQIKQGEAGIANIQDNRTSAVNGAYSFAKVYERPANIDSDRTKYAGVIYDILKGKK